jgi:hypothetical protein
MRNAAFFIVGIFLAVAVVAGCTASASVNTTPPPPGGCQQDNTIACTAPQTGYTCTGGSIPDASLMCGSEMGIGTYCCGSTTVVASMCGMNSAVTCPSGQTGMSCTGSSTPDLSANCGSPMIGTHGATNYCCGTVTNTGGSCAMDSTVTGCTGGSTGYSCTSTDTPDQTNPALGCSVGVAGNAGSTLFCCLASTYAWSASSCAPDQTVTGCQSGSYGFSCASTDTPDQTDAELVCSTGVAGNAGSTLFCCTSETITSTCAPDATVNGCTGDAAGYSCTGADPPDMADPTLECSIGVAGNAGSTLYCCLGSNYAWGTSSCAQDNTVMCTQPENATSPPVYGFSCAGSDMPSMTDSSLNCSAGVAGMGGATLFCCVPM